ncbi:exosortase C-terminal domain/associated protein EpsI [Sphingomonas sp. LHG3406-1]|uniref:exosortase C-terminal domain/associated protein EpsI n=1 Tax=Sphingomonas sp. LHG3406-1 TaxID=2804617 RepID=UPI0026246F04|nr:exosortase C-terminal domain/associated protein EpsI [Sphingomonas sp. LHG3406-1]
MIGSRREFLVAAGCGAAALGGGLMSSRGVKAPEDLGVPVEQLLPEQLGEWRLEPRSDLLIPRGDSEEEAVYDQLLTRVYSSGAAPPVMLLIAYGSSQTGTTQLHRPEVCYPAAGFALEDRPAVQLPISRDAAVEARTMTARTSGRIEQILYWSRIGRDFPVSALGQRWSLLRQAASGGVPDGALVRMSTIMLDYRAALPVLTGFARKLLELPGPARRLLTGVDQGAGG